jgi:cyclic lactone autoinducer peptide
MRVLRKLIYFPLVLFALAVAAVGVKPASFFLWYQPELPGKK